VLELRDKLPTSGTAEPAQVVPGMDAIQEDVLSALVNLGYQRAVVEKALASVGKNGSFETMFRAALAAVAK